MHWPNGASAAARCQMHLFRQTT
ncbi:hypothetical protein [uncultured Boseongicola sp.]